MTSIDIVTSALNEDGSIPELIKRLTSVLNAETNYTWRILIFDNGSSDNTWVEIKKSASSDVRIKGFRMSRTFTLDAALTAGIDVADADLVILMTSDMQDPPEAIPQLLRKYEEGYEQVLVRITRRDSVPLFRRLLSQGFYKVASWLTGGMLPELVSDFRLLTRRTYKSISQMRESHRFLRGLGAWVGFRTTYIELERPPRFAGQSSWLRSSLLSVVTYALKSIFSHSARPLMWVSGLGLMLSVLSVGGTVVMSITWIFGTVPFAGFGTIVALISLGFSLTMLCIGVLAQYLALVYDEVKQRPIYIIAEETE